jgi:hypothetical protein
MDKIDAKHAKHGMDENRNEMINDVTAPKPQPIADFFPSTTLMCKYMNVE